MKKHQCLPLWRIALASSVLTVPKQSDRVYPFVVQGGKTYINSAVIASASINEAMINNLSVSRAKIQDAAIDNTKIANAAIRSAHIMDGVIDSAKISQQIQSSNWDGTNGWMINKNGTANFCNVTVRGNIQATSGVLNNVTINENCNILGTSASLIVGDQVVHNLQVSSLYRLSLVQYQVVRRLCVQYQTNTM
ncbi:phage tail tip fiber protein [Enterobacter cloacae complex sp. 357B1]|uniref:phage tail tip fiber protein n=1 Tax=Enterobacter cloacae complex sp. 357B1 TaxID=3395827 RepID=UPI003CEF68AD